MSDENHMRRNLRELLGSDIILRKRRLTKQSKDKQIFCEVLNDIKLLMERSYCLEHDYGISLEGWDEKFMYVIDGLLNLKFDKPQRDLINWWLFDKHTATGEIQELNDIDSGKVIPSDTAEDIWELISSIKKLDKK